MMNRLLITGAAGGLGSMCRDRLKHMAKTLRLSDVVEMPPAGENEEVVVCDLGDKAAVEDLVRGCDGIVHLGGRSIEDTWSVIRNANIDGVFNLYEACRNTGCNRVIFASSNHAVGFHKQTTRLDANALTQPDGLYGVSKVFGEAMASMYYNKFGIETASVRIGSCFPEPKNRRMLASWMSYDDFVRLIEAVFRAPKIGCPIVYGASNNATGWWDNREVGFLGWEPQDRAEDYRAVVEQMEEMPAIDAPQVVYQGGAFTADGIHEE
ncbi:NAD-dependent epimerase/dehydratase family protein [Vannielia sp. SX4]|uniref:NAD-dependent epimerase/dehydratase family protein n=1 Tax=Vannielia sp. SX4 TaxID=3463852 RepID=UPI004058BBD5